MTIESGHPSDESQIGQNDFQIRMRNPQGLYRAIRRNFSGEIGTAQFPELLRTAVVKVETNAYLNQFQLSGTINDGASTFRDVSNPVSQDEFRQLVSFLHGQYGEMTEERRGTGGSYYYLKGRNDTHMIFHKDGGSVMLRLDTGGNDRQNPYRLNSLTAQLMTGIIDDFTNAFQTLIEGNHSINGKDIPQQNLILAVPPFEQQIDTIRSPMPAELKGKVDLLVPDVSFDDVGGQDKAKRELQKIALSLDQPHLYREWGTHPPKGILLEGPTGTGKALLAQATASESDAFFISVSLTEITSKYYGETEKFVPIIFNWAAKLGGVRPTILYFDEIDAIGISRENAHEATQRTLIAFLSAMSGFKAGGNVIVLASTNRINDIDKALLRPERFDRKIHVGLPNAEGLKQITQIKMRQAEELAGRKLFAGVDFNQITSRMKDFNGADVAEIVRRTLEEKVVLKAHGEEPRPVTTENFLIELENYEKESS